MVGGTEKESESPQKPPLTNLSFEEKKEESLGHSRGRGRTSYPRKNKNPKETGGTMLRINPRQHKRRQSGGLHGRGSCPKDIKA